MGALDWFLSPCDTELARRFYRPLVLDADSPFSISLPDGEHTGERAREVLGYR